MKTIIQSIEDTGNSDYVKITALVYWRGLPPPRYSDNETDEQYSERVMPIALDLNSYNNLHLGWADLHQFVDEVSIPKVNEYDT